MQTKISEGFWIHYKGAGRVDETETSEGGKVIDNEEVVPHSPADWGSGERRELTQRIWCTLELSESHW